MTEKVAWLMDRPAYCNVCPAYLIGKCQGKMAEKCRLRVVKTARAGTTVPNYFGTLSSPEDVAREACAGKIAHLLIKTPGTLRVDVETDEATGVKIYRTDLTVVTEEWLMEKGE